MRLWVSHMNGKNKDVRWYWSNSMHWTKNIPSTLNYCGLVRDATWRHRHGGQHWIRQWLVAWPHKSITWTIIALSSIKYHVIQLGTISQELHRSLITKFNFEITYLKFLSNLPWVNDRKMSQCARNAPKHSLRTLKSNSPWNVTCDSNAHL